VPSFFFRSAFFPLAHLATAAFRALSLRSSGVNLAALTFPPFEPPSFPRAKHLRGIIAFGFAVRRKIYKSKCFGHYREEVNSSPILMASERSMASTA
jgi:hypothetical protein